MIITERERKTLARIINDVVRNTVFCGKTVIKVDGEELMALFTLSEKIDEEAKANEKI